MISHLLAVLASRKAAADLMRVAQELAVAAAPAVRATLQLELVPAHHAEACGYLRGKTTPQVRQQLAAFCDRLPASLASQLQVEATERVIRLLIDDVLRVGHLRRAA
ncbi:MAG TPA: hypothetical protein VHZ24_06745 [Pirellulales bacterium]|jgi:hypothetical protein|nr:hypothetical protein [Pirellulales bacterium]